MENNDKQKLGKVDLNIDMSISDKSKEMFNIIECFLDTYNDTNSTINIEYFVNRFNEIRKDIYKNI